FEPVMAAVFLRKARCATDSVLHRRIGGWSAAPRRTAHEMWTPLARKREGGPACFPPMWDRTQRHGCTIAGCSTGFRPHAEPALAERGRSRTRGVDVAREGRSDAPRAASAKRHDGCT